MIGTMVKKSGWGNTSCGLLVLRIGLAAVFIMAGWMKVSNLDATVGAFASMGFSSFWAYVASFVELLGGVAILLGAFTRTAAALILVNMLIATFFVHKDTTLLLHVFSLLALVLAGGGKYSVMKKACGCGTCKLCNESDVTPSTTPSAPQM